ncbi:MAG: FUSC family protein, partial [Zoogloea sp.]|nr:FUSC family protein [Zoogloea sp.]
LLVRLADEFRAYCATQASLDAGDSGKTSLDAVSEQTLVRFSTRSDPLLVGLAALRGMAVTLFAGGFWLASGWTWGAGAMTNAVAAGTLFAALPSPVRVIRHFLIGCCIALPVGLVWNFWLIPQASDWIGLGLVLIPPLAFAAWLAVNPPTAGIGAGFYICFMLHSSLERSFNLQLTDFVEGHLADFCGASIAGMFYLLTDPNLGAWRQRRTVRALRRQLVDICRGEGTLRREELESASRDLVKSIATRGQLSDEADRWVFDWLLAVLEVGRAVIDLRAMMAEGVAEAVPMSVSFALHRLGELFAAPSAERLAAALAAVNDAIAVLSPEAAGETADAAQPRLPARDRQAMILDLHFIRTALLDQSTRPVARS